MRNFLLATAALSLIALSLPANAADASVAGACYQSARHETVRFGANGMGRYDDQRYPMSNGMVHYSMRWTQSGRNVSFTADTPPWGTFNFQEDRNTLVLGGKNIVFSKGC